ncbi:MAG: hypothetical protein DI551_07525 [Micavibrio aeruginosavorus]|uniref:DUF4199 domain-containing protein n=1 Tax=Micavibrio aeruginosavorus TaxID=349221 RepID=A0A2W5Q214_9BACT|nr:MAG: hypothetical protein DI551_07525 [Micavibrio aeruginosavorus]
MENAGQKKIINALYGLLVVSTILGFMPNFNAFLASFVLWAAVLAASYLYRRKDSEDGLLYNHMTYLIGTIWIGTAFILLGTIIAGLWVFLQGDGSILDAAIAKIESGAAIDEAELTQITHDYITANKGLLMTASFAAVGPAVLYFVYRVANGYGRAMKGYRIANPKSWL